MEEISKKCGFPKDNYGKITNMLCIKGLADGIVQFSPPGIEVKKALEFCQNKFLTNGEKEECFNVVFGHINMRYSGDKAEEFCESVNLDDQRFCRTQ